MPLFGLAVLVRESPEKAAAVAAAASAISLSGPKSTAKGSRPEALFRAYYAMNAARRLSRAKDPEKALEREKLYFALHQKAQKLRMHSAKATESMVALHGPILSWHHGHPKEPRPNHLAADGHNFDTRRGVPQLTGALPGELPNCTCYWGPPIPGAPELR
ncbi:hypothetical protein [Rubrobacter calidifluminis]|uniref:hypothetical protein n=1 Tax=Rubrobacter calidifluminis TaxID=1392640 RepID=UPI00235E94DA|nr:hypothetical protein [Rubrobacter calidifluminis]